jgi:hypothetical protein
MAKNIKELLEGTSLSEDAATVIQEAWESNLAEAREAITAELPAHRDGRAGRR